jgi:hypothetical protein
MEVELSHEGQRLQLEEQIERRNGELSGLPTDDAAGGTVEGLTGRGREVGGRDQFVQDLGHSYYNAGDAKNSIEVILT